ncbi:recombination mediator RecR [Corynebacterium urealyticum]|uniref:Recombination protein RecR n=1 Tax=Corynebacterium urealyticum (strain ATCC 43042 / DSM 7109) TaxID=504474 RepID=B1VIS4_CORU7|nr:recombination mediator RecR [Corynebacterium urealyticum]AGE37420.1 recombination protein [Corynebacterium urealyticum DSM 7111]QQB07250.1 recombination protein RecR [Corynebacterium urealyticum]QQC42582.1 recombination protein RecR [Corynebacterium urealyticum]CAQ05870.1 recombination protein [Corynebacterium urealyticum DSM 7109]SNV91801.1 recombination protein RecR [Corynebacterium urealyticum]
MFEGPLQDVIDEFASLPGIGPKSAQRIALHLLENATGEDIERFQATLGNLHSGVAFCRICHNISQEDVCRICADSSRDASLVCVVEEPKDIQVIERTGEYRGRYHVLGGALDPLNGVGPGELNVTALVQRIGGVLPDVAVSAPHASAGGPVQGSLMDGGAGAGTGGGSGAGAGGAGVGSDGLGAGAGSEATGNERGADEVEYREAPEITEVIIATDPNTEGEATASYLGRLLKEFPGLTVSRLASGIPMGGDLEFVDELTLSRAFAGRTQLKL